MTVLRNYFKQQAELDRQVKTELPWTIRRAIPNLKVEGGWLSFDDHGDMLNADEAIEVVRELMHLLGIVEAKPKTASKKKGRTENVDLDASKASDDYGPCSEDDRLARLLATDPQSAG